MLIADSFIFLWFLFVYLNCSCIEMGNISAVMEKIRAGFVLRFMGFIRTENEVPPLFC
ncbi:MAG TPA: hypothetical protein O0Y17_02060 [Methanocorpusculum sp.]|nr:hypothetical protein [Methanocorpusculum sp.]